MIVLVAIRYTFANGEGSMEVTPVNEAWSGLLKMLKQLDINQEKRIKTFLDGSKVELVVREVTDSVGDDDDDEEEESTGPGVGVFS